MSTVAPAWSVFLGLALSLLILAWLSRQVSLHLQGVVFLLTGSMEMATVILFLVFLPGVFIHEGAHWITARLLGLRTSRFRVWPEQRRNRIGLGSVHVSSGGVWIDSLVGLAPMLVGSVIIALIGHWVFDTTQMAGGWSVLRLRELLSDLPRAITRNDGIVWAYLHFAVANAMMPSASDREPVKPVLLYIAAAALIYLILGLPLDWLVSALSRLIGPTQILTNALSFVILLDLAVWAMLYALGLLLSLARRAPQ